MKNSIKTQDSTWYVAIIRMGKTFYPFIAAGGEAYRDYAQSAKRHGMEVVAEQFKVSNTRVNRLTGFDAIGKKTGMAPLSDFVDRFNSNYSSVQLELEKLCAGD